MKENPLKYDKDAAAIIAAVGGEANIDSLYHCVTRLRFGLKDNSKADQAALTAISPVMGVNEAGSQYQVIIGNDVPDVYNAIVAELPRLAGGDSVDGAAAAAGTGDKKKLHTRFLDFISAPSHRSCPPLTVPVCSRASWPSATPSAGWIRRRRRS